MWLPFKGRENLEIKLLRHATQILNYNSKRILVDPLLSEAGCLPPIPGTANRRPNPLVSLPVSLEEALNVDAYLVTHVHVDHFDGEARKVLPRQKPLFCQPGDERKFRRWGFRDVRVVEEKTIWQGITLHRTGGSHGRGLTARLLGPVSGFCLAARKEPSLYIAGDTVFSPQVAEALDKHRPDGVVLYAGGARLLLGGAITMEEIDIVRVLKKAPRAQIFVVHMEAINHCFLKRKDLTLFLEKAGLAGRARVLQDGEKAILARRDWNAGN